MIYYPGRQTRNGVEFGHGIADRCEAGTVGRSAGSRDHGATTDTGSGGSRRGGRGAPDPAPARPLSTGSGTQLRRCRLTLAGLIPHRRADHGSSQRRFCLQSAASPQRLLRGVSSEASPPRRRPRRRGGAPVIGARVPSSGEPAAGSRRSDGWRLDLSTTAAHGNNPSANRPPVYTLRHFRAALFDLRQNGRTGLFVCVCVWEGRRGALLGVQTTPAVSRYYG